MARRVSGGEDPHLGLVLDRQFRVDELIGTGAMAHVYRARHLPIERDVAIKILRRELLKDSEIVARFRREAQIAARLAHPNVIVVHAVGEVPEEEEECGGEPYVALELLAGPSLSTVLTNSGEALPLARALHIVLAVCDAVGEAHAQGIVHRDVKPDNVMLVRRGGDEDFVKVLDFGLAKTLEDNADLRTRAGAVLGTPRYMSPEGAEGRPVSPASDCYSLATLLYRCLAGRTPFDGESPVRILVQQATAQPPDFGSIAGSPIPPPIARVVMQNLAKRPEGRAPDGRALGRALVDAARASEIDVEAIGLSSTLLGSAIRPLPRVQEPAATPSTTKEVSAPSKDVSAPAEPAVLLAPASTPSRRASGVSGSSGRARRARPLFARRLVLFVVCFLVGAAAALGVASSLGAFAPAPHGSIE